MTVSLLLRSRDSRTDGGNLLFLHKRTFAGQELMPKYINMVVNSGSDDETSCDQLRKLVKWKNIRDISWTMKDGSLTSSSFEGASVKDGDSDSGSNMESVSQESPTSPLDKN